LPEVGEPDVDGLMRVSKTDLRVCVHSVTNDQYYTCSNEIDAGTHASQLATSTLFCVEGQGSMLGNSVVRCS
jgi:hypothetical protein